MFAAFKAGLVAGQHELPLRRRRARLPVGQRRLPSPSCSTARSPTASSAIRDRVPGVRDVAVGRRRARGGPCPDWATPYEDAAAAGTDERRARAAVGPRRRPPPHALHRRHHRHAQGRDVAPGRPVPQPRRRAQRPRSATTPSTTTVVDGGVAGPGFVGLPACPLMHGTGCFTQLILLVGRRLDRASPSHATLDVDRAARHDRAGEGQPARRSSATPSPSRSCASPRRQPRHAGTSRSMFMIASSGVMFSEESKQGLLAPQPGDDDHRRLLLVGGHRAWASRSRPPAGTSTTAKFTLGENTQGDHRGRPRRRAGLRRDRPASPSAASSRSATTRTRRRRRPPSSPSRASATRCPGDYAHGRGRRLPHPARPRVGVHQHRRREGLPRGGRGGAEDPPRRARRRRRRRARRQVRRGDHRRRRAGARHRARRAPT